MNVASLVFAYRQRPLSFSQLLFLSLHLTPLLIVSLSLFLPCTGSPSLSLLAVCNTLTEVPVEKIVYKEVPVEVIVEKEVPVEKYITVEVPVEKIVYKEVVFNLAVFLNTAPFVLYYSVCTSLLYLPRFFSFFSTQ
jgi:hypothetical protein